MTNSAPSCVVQVTYTPQTGFSYSLDASASTAGWTVGADGSIQAPGQANWQGIAIVFEPAPLSPADLSHPIGGLQVLDSKPPAPWPPPTGVTPPYRSVATGVSVQPDLGCVVLTCDKPSVSPDPYYYCLAINFDNGLVWDDPKIYDDGSQ